MAQKKSAQNLKTHDAQLDKILSRFHRALSDRRLWETRWQDCYDYTLPFRNAFITADERRYDRVFDATAADAADQLAASLLAELTPPWSRWFGFRPGPQMAPEDHAKYAPLLDEVQRRLQSHFDRSNFAVEMHQSFLDLVTVGTGSLAFEEAAPGEFSAFRFAAVPLADVVLGEGIEGRLTTTYRQLQLTAEDIAARYPNADLPLALTRAQKNNGSRQSDKTQTILEYVVPAGNAFNYGAIWEGDGSPHQLFERRVGHSPFLHFRWLKSPGETYGRSPVMKALPDIKTANKVVELVLKNASIAVTGIWQADDDGVLNPANIKLIPGAIIPKAVGSAGLTPLAAPGKFDVSQLMLTDLRANIRSALLVDQLGPITDQKMTATEVLQRSSDMARLLGAVYGRMQSELLTPLIMRALAILERRGEIPPLQVDGRFVELHYLSPLAIAQAGRDGDNVLSWLSAVKSLGAPATNIIDATAIAEWLGDLYGVPSSFMTAPQS
jgi:hypothetical protein